MQFVHLHLHSYYSILDGEGKIENYFKKAAADHQPAMALTDHGNMFGVKEFLKTAKKFKGVVKPIVGCEVYVNPEGRFVKRGKEDQGAYHLILLAKNIEGYYNLVKIVSIGWTEGFYYKPKVDREILEKYHENLIASSACLGGELPRLIAAGNMEEAEKSALWFKKVFGEDYYLEIQQHRTEVPGQSQEVFEKQKIVNAGLFKLSEKLGIKCIATNDCHFVNKEDGPAHDRLICINTNARVTDADRMHYTQQEYMKTAEEMAAMHITHPEIITNTLEVAAKVEEYDIDHDHILPIFKLPDGYSDSNDYLRDLVYKGAETRYPNMLPKLKERIDFELQTIKGMGFPDYFLIVQDFINAARAKGIWVGPGRGSAAGSVVAYCLGITKIDPIKYDLLFERFLNPERISMPDIDIDFEEERRGDVLAYVEGKYGKDHVSHVVTFGTMATKSAIKDIARIEDVPLAVANKLAGMVPSSFPEEQVKVKRPDGTEETDSKKVAVNFDNCLKLVPEFRQEYEHPETPEVGETMKYARMLEGTVRNTGVHACAVIIGRDKLSEHIPISIAKDKDTGNDIWVSQYEGSDIEDVGMLKMDFLGLRTLSILKETVENIKKSKKIDVDVDTLPLNDKATFKLFGKGDTVAVFQFESPGMQKWLRELKPNRFEDLIAMNALYRPGPMQYIPDFVNRKNGRTKIVYEMPEMEDILSDTYGVTVYQEQVMLLSQRIASFSRGQADGLRKAMGKKKIDKMMEMEELFMKGGIANGYKEEQLKKIWNDWKEFAKYAFNKSHSTCYAWIAYQTAWLKAHYPAEFMAANMSKNLGDIAEISKLMDECKRMKIKVLGPDVNESGVDFTVTGDNEIRFGLAAIKGVGGAASEVIINNAPYKSIFDFAEKAGNGNINRKTIESLAYAGAFDSSFPEIRRDQYFSENSKGEIFLDALVRYSQIVNKKEDNGGSLFGETDTGFEAQTPEIPAAKEDINNLEFLEKEKEMVGMYISSHPLDMYKFEIDNFTSYNLVQASALVQQVKNNPALADRDFYVGGIVSSLTKKVSQKSGKPFASMTLEDYAGIMQFSVFGKDFETFLPFLNQGAALFIKCKLRKRYNSETDYEIRIQKITFLANLKEQFMKGLTLYIQSEKLDKNYRKDLVNTIKENKGTTPLNIVMTEAERSISLSYASSKKVNVDRPLLEELEKMDIKYKAITSVSM
ncbi:MAG: DNA polymerase III subunit alpha [Bacteroidales bacterium]|nr:DNA polymerase III subunit alpha [Bacteroidales bacterium]